MVHLSKKSQWNLAKNTTPFQDDFPKDGGTVDMLDKSGAGAVGKSSYLMWNKNRTVCILMTGNSKFSKEAYEKIKAAFLLRQR